MQVQAVDDGGHAELAHAVVDVVTVGRVLEYVDAARPVGVVRAGQVGRAADQLGQVRGEFLDARARGLAGGDLLVVALHLGQDLLDQAVEVVGQLAFHAPLEFGGLFRVRLFVSLEALVPGLFGGRALLAGVPGGADVVGNLERAVLPAQLLAGGGDFVLAQGGAVHAGGAGLVGGTEADGGLAADQRGLVVHRGGAVDGGRDGLGTVAVDVFDHVPAVGLEAGGGVVVEPAVGVAVDGDVVVVVEHDQLAQLERAGQRAGLVRDAFHQAAVAGEHPGVVIDDVVLVGVVAGGQQFFGQRHADAIGQALPQRAGGGFHARRVLALGVARRHGMELAEVLELFHRQVVAGQVQHAVEQHRAVTVGDDEAVAVPPVGVGRVVLVVVVEEHFGDVGHAHGHTRVA